jgi:probable phosphoglycerate mutase
LYDDLLREELMARTLYLMRHGETLFNVQHKIQGWCDSPLTQAGIDQAKATGRLLAARGVSPDVFACSTAERASDTLELVMAELGRTGEDYQRLKGLKEHNHGIYEGEGQYLEPPFERFESFFVEAGGEAISTVSARMVEALDGLFADEQVQTLLAVSHAGAIFSFFSATGGEDRILNPLPNCACVVFDFDPSWSDDPAQRFRCREVIRP